MRLSILQNGRVLRHLAHAGGTYVEAPPSGTYAVRLHNDSPQRRLAVLSVDGINVVDGKDAGYEGTGYVLGPWQTADVPGWRRSDQTVASFEFKEQGASYAAQSGRGTKNVGVVGVAVFDEKPCAKPVPFPHYPNPYYPNPYRPWNDPYRPVWRSGEEFLGDHGSERGDGRHPKGLSSTFNVTRGAESSLGRRTKSLADVGTGYGAETSFATSSTSFERATESPAEVLTVRYATRERLTAMGVPLDAPEAPSAFPASTWPSVPAPPGWDASR